MCRGCGGALRLLAGAALAVAGACAAGADADGPALGADGVGAAGTSFVAYTLVVADEGPAAGPHGVAMLRGWLTVAGLTAMACGDAARAEPPGWAERAYNALVPLAHAGHSGAGLPDFQVLGSEVVALHRPASTSYGLGQGDRGALCRLHLLLGRAEADAPSLAALPAEVTMARMSLHLELAFSDGGVRTVRTDVGWGVVKEALPALPAAGGSAVVVLRPLQALAAAFAEADPGAASDDDVGRAVLKALCEGAGVAFVAD